MGDVVTVEGVTEEQLSDAVIDSIAEERGHIPLPAGAFTVEGYMARVKKRGGPELGHETALRTLREEKELGKLEGRKVACDGNHRWVFWPANGQEARSVGEGMGA